MFKALVSHSLLIAAWAALVLFVPADIFHAVLSTLFLLIVPGYLAYCALIGNPSDTPLSRRLPYFVGLSLMLNMLSGLLLNEGYDLFGLSRPLSLIPLTVTISSLCMILIFIAALKQRLSFKVPKLKLNAKVIRHKAPAVILCLLMPVLAAGGAVTLNNGGTAGIAMLVFGLIASLFLIFVWRVRDFSQYYTFFLFSASLSILIGTSLRGWNITGHDVMQEYQVFRLTLSHAAWHMHYYQDAYMACLSITILPTVFQKLTLVSDPYIYKLIFQGFFALIGPVVYEAIRPFTSKRTALLAAFLFITFPTFLTDMMMLNRQETALLFLALALMASGDKKLSRNSKSLLIITYLAGMVLSHYSTSYEALGTFVWAILIAYGWRIFQRKSLRRKKTPPINMRSIFSLPIIMAAVVLLVGWGSIATQTTNNIAQTFTSLEQTIKTRLTSKSQPTPPSSLTQFAASSRLGEGYPSSAFYPNSITKNYPLLSAQPSKAPTTKAARSLGLNKGMLNSVYSLIKNSYELVIAASIPLGLLYLLLTRKKHKLPLQFIFLGAGAFIMVAIELAFPEAVNYGLARAIQQSLLFAALPIILLLRWLIMRFRIRRDLAEKLTAIILILFFLVLSGLLPTITGGSDPVLPLSNSGLYYSAYYTHDEEIAAGNWLKQDAPSGSQINSDEFARRKLIAYDEIFSQPTLAPSAIPKDSYVYLSYGDNKFDQVPVYDGDALLYYKPPTAFLQTYKNEVYSSNNVTIYK